MSIKTAQMTGSSGVRWAMVLLLAAAAFFASYRYASARNGNPGDGANIAALPAIAGAGAGSSGCACCGGTTPPAGADLTKGAEIDGDVQKITVDVSKGYYDPSTIELKAGIPAEITFGQGSGCLAQVQSQELGFFEDLTGGPRTVKLGALEAGTYSFTCGMQMVSGTIVVK